jgi:hypothetical protein
VLNLVDLRGELLRHPVELRAERRELVAALHRNRPREVARGQAARRGQELVDLPLEGTHDHDRRQQRQQ